MDQRFGADVLWHEIGVLPQAVAGTFDLYGRNAKLTFSASLMPDARNTGLYRHPKYRRSLRRPRIP